MKTSVLVAVCLLIAAGEACNDIDNQVTALVQAINGFSQRLYQQVAVNNVNAVLSTFSIHEELSMLLLGARSYTKAELSTTLGLDGNLLPHQTYKAVLTQLPWVASGYTTLITLSGQLQKEYVTDVQNYYFADVLKCHLEGSEEHYIQNQTNIQIANTGFDVDLFLANIIKIVVFSGAWQQPFDVGRTSPNDFFTRNKTIQVLTVHDQRKVNIKRNIYSADVAELPFANNRFSFYIALPHDVDGLPALESQLNSTEAVNELFTNLVSTWVSLSIPRFSVRSRFFLKSALEELGIRQAFNSSLANFQGMTNSSNVYIPEVYHSSLIEFTEEGIRAPAVNISIIFPTVGDPPTESFNTDHPFLFFLRDKTLNLTLSQGKFSG